MTDASGRTTTSLHGIPSFDSVGDPTPGLVLVYSRIHDALPAALPFAATRVTLGREADNTLSIAEAAISRYHARIERREDGWWLLDLQSTNGSFVNGQRIQEHRLEAQDVVRVGDTLFRYAAQSIYAYSAYRLDGTVVQQVRPTDHQVEAPLLIGGYQIDALLDSIAKIARSQISVVVTGESGTGKELVARELHQQSGRKGPLQAINCAALPASLIESELFGYRRGAFSGATSDKIGLLRAAHMGTLFLDEIGDMPLEAQSKLLRVLQEREVLPLGATSPEPVDVRVCCATHRDLDALVAEGRFRGDLLARLREFAAKLPPLRERREDLWRLIRHFLQIHGREDLEVTFPAMLALAHYDWPYNVRELESAIKVAVTLASQGTLDVPQLPEPVRRMLDGQVTDEPPAPSAMGPGTTMPARQAAPMHRPEASMEPPPAAPAGRRSALPRGAAPTADELRDLMARHRGNIAAVGRELGRERMQIHRWLRRYEIDIDSYRR